MHLFVLLDLEKEENLVTNCYCESRFFFLQRPQHSEIDHVVVQSSH